MVMSYTAIPYNERGQNIAKSTDGSVASELTNNNNHNNHVTSNVTKPNRHSSLAIKSPNSMPRRSSNAINHNNIFVHASTIGYNPTNNHTSPPGYEQEIYEGFTFLQSQKQRKPTLLNCPFHAFINQLCWYKPKRGCLCKLSAPSFCVNQPLSFSNDGLERIYQKYFITLYQSTLLTEFYVCLTILCVAMSLLGFANISSGKKDTTNASNDSNYLYGQLPMIKYGLLISIGIFSIIPIIYMNIQCCMRPKHLFGIKIYGFLLCFLYLIAISPLMMLKETDPSLILSIGIWEILLLILIIGLFYQLSLYAFLGSSCLLFIVHSIIGVVMCLVPSLSQPKIEKGITSTTTGSITKTSITGSPNGYGSIFTYRYMDNLSWFMLAGNWLLFIATCLICSIVNYLHQKLLRKSFLCIREFLNNCVDSKIASEKLDRLLGCIAPSPILPELRLAALSSSESPINHTPLSITDILNTSDQSNKSTNNNGPPVVHLRNVSFISVIVLGLGQLVMNKSKNDNKPTNPDSSSDAEESSSTMMTHNRRSDLSADAIKLMNELFSRFDMLGQELGCYRIRADPDDYLAISGYPETRVDHARSCVELGARINQTIRQLGEQAGLGLQVKIGVHTGATYGTVVGAGGGQRPAFDLLGDDVRAVKQIVLAADHGKVLVSKSTFDQLPDEYKGEAGPSIDVPVMTTSASTPTVNEANKGALSNCGVLDTWIMKPRHMKQNSLLVGELNGLAIENDKSASNLVQFTLTDLPITSIPNKQSPDSPGNQLTNENRSVLTQSQGVKKLTQHAKFNVNTPYYFLFDDNSYFDDNRLFSTDVANNPTVVGVGLGVTKGVVNSVGMMMSGSSQQQPVPYSAGTTSHTFSGTNSLNPGSPLYGGTNKSSTTWKSTLRSQMTQSLIGTIQIEEGDIADDPTKDQKLDLVISKLTGTFIKPVVESEFQQWSETYIGFSLVACLFFVILLAGVHGLLLPKTSVLLLLFLVVFIWICFLLLILLLAKLKCISDFAIRSRRSCAIIMVITVLGMFAVFAANSMCCNTTQPLRLNLVTRNKSSLTTTKSLFTSKPASSMYSTTKTLINNRPHLNCPAPIYSIITTLWVLLPMLVMFFIPNIVKMVLFAVCGGVNCIIIFYTHAELFRQYGLLLRETGFTIQYMSAIFLQLFICFAIMLECRILNTFRRLEYKWGFRNKLKLEENQKLNLAIEGVIDNLLPQSVSRQLLRSTKHYMNLYSRPHNNIHILSICIPNWSPSNKNQAIATEPSDVAGYIRQLNKVLQQFDQVIYLPECGVATRNGNQGDDGNGCRGNSCQVTKIRSAGETAWFGIDIDDGDTTSADNTILSQDTLLHNRQRQALAILHAAEMMKKVVEDHNVKYPEYHFSYRIGIHSGTAYSGVIGSTKPIFSVWGEANVGATLIQRYSQFDKIHISGQFFSELEPAYRDNFYDVGVLHANHLGQIIPATPNNNSRWNLRVLCLNDGNNNQQTQLVSSTPINSQVNYQQQQQQIPMTTSNNPPQNHLDYTQPLSIVTSHNNNPNSQQQVLMMNSNLISLCSDDSVFPVTGLSAQIPPQQIQHHSPQQRNSMSFNPPIISSCTGNGMVHQPISNHDSYHPLQPPQQQQPIMMNQQSYMVQSNILASPSAIISSMSSSVSPPNITSSILPPHNHMIPIQPATSPPLMNQPPTQLTGNMNPNNNDILMMMMRNSNNNNHNNNNNNNNMVRSQGEFTSNNNNNNCSNVNNNRRNRIHRYKNLATELPNSIIPPSPPPHKRTYNENSCESPPVIPPRNNANPNSYNEKALMTQSDMLIPLSSTEHQHQLPQKSIHSKTKLSAAVPRAPPSHQHLSVQQRSALTPSSSMDSFLEMEKACSGGNGSMQHSGRAKSALYSDVPVSTIGSGVALGPGTDSNQQFTQRLSLIPEGANYVFQKDPYNPNLPNVPNNRLNNNIDIMTTSDDRLLLGGVDVMTTSDDRVFEQQNHLNNNHANMANNANSNLLLAVDNSDITSHHNPIYTDNEYESMVESQMNLLDQDGSKINVVMRTRGMVHEMSLDFPDYKRPDSPPCPGNGDDSDHLSKRNRNSSNSRDSSSCMATNNGATSNSNQGNRSSSHSNQSMTDNKSSNRNSSINHSSDENNAKNNGNNNDENNNNKGNKRLKEKHSPTSIEMSEDKSNFLSNKSEQHQQFPGNHLSKHHVNPPMSNIGAVAPDNASSCISLVTDLGGWTSYDEQDYYDGSEHQSHNNGILSNNDSYDYHRNQGNSKVNRQKSKKSHKNHFGDDEDYDEGNNMNDDDDDDDLEEDESDIDAMRLHSDLISDYSENPLVSDLEDLTDTDISYQHSLMSFADDKSNVKGVLPRGFTKKSGYLGDYNTSTGGSTGSSTNFSNKNGSGKGAGGGFYKFPVNNRLNPRFYQDNNRVPFGEEKLMNRNGSNQPHLFASHPWSGPNISHTHSNFPTNTDSSDHIYSLPATDTIDQKHELAKPNKHKKLPEIAPVKIPDFTKPKQHPRAQLQQNINSSAALMQKQQHQQQSTSTNSNNAPISRIPIRRIVSNNNSTKNSENSSLNKLSDQSEYDNIENKNNERIGKHLVRNVRSLDGDGESTNRNKILMNGLSEDSDAMSGYIGDVASSVYDSDYEDEDNNNQFLDNDDDEEIDEDDPMGRFFPRLQTKNTQEAASSLSCNNPVSSDHNSSSKQASRASSTGAIRSDYDNVNSDELPRKQIPIKNSRRMKLKNHPEDEFVQQQIAEEARKISQIYKRQWTNQSGGNQTDDGNMSNYEDKQSMHNYTNQSALFRNSRDREPSSSDDLLLEARSNRETSADMLDEGDEDSSWDSPDRNEANNIGRSDQELRCQSTDCVLSTSKKQLSSSPEQRRTNPINTQQSEQFTEVHEHNQNPNKSQNSQKPVTTDAAKGLQKLQERASKVRSLLPPELHPYVLPGCISNSSVNSCSDTNGIGEGVKKQGGRKQRNGIPVYKASAKKRQHFSDEERSKRSV